MAELSNAEIDTATGTNKVYQATFDQLTNLVGEVTDSVLCASDPTASPTSTVEYCGCPQCTQSVWDTVVCNDVAGSPGVTECFSCGDRITFKQSLAGGSLSLSEACTFVSEETFLNDQCGPMCNPDTCITPEVSVLYWYFNFPLSSLALPEPLRCHPLLKHMISFILLADSESKSISFVKSNHIVLE